MGACLRSACVEFVNEKEKKKNSEIMKSDKGNKKKRVLRSNLGLPISKPHTPHQAAKRCYHFKMAMWMEKWDATINSYGETFFSKTHSFSFKKEQNDSVPPIHFWSMSVQFVWCRTALSRYIISQLWVIFTPFFPQRLNDFISSPPPHHLSMSCLFYVCLPKTFFLSVQHLLTLILFVF